MRRREFIGAAAAQASAAVLPATGKSCIVLVMAGGVSQLDTLDPKPDAPSEIRGPFRAIRTSAPEIRIAELFPKLARQAHRFALLRSMHYSDELLHEEGVDLALGSFFRPRVLPLSSNADRERYGCTAFGDQCLAARKRVERGTHTVVIEQPGWDSHGYDPYSTMATYRDLLAPTFDSAASALIADLAEQGLLDNTLVVALTEFGRTPKINPQGGRDHWTGCWTTLLAGGGIEGGQVLGTSDGTASEPRDNPVTPAMLHELITLRIRS
jgi:uncharacterized protein (DUF1501 family)